MGRNKGSGGRYAGWGSSSLPVAPPRDASVQLTVVKRGSSQPLPTVQSGGLTWVVANAGEEFDVQAAVQNPQYKQLQLCLSVDGVSVGYSKICHSTRAEASIEFEGFVEYIGSASTTTRYRAFRFGACTPATGAATVQHPDDIKAGRLEAKMHEVVPSGQLSALEGYQQLRVGADEARRVKLAGSKKFFLAPGLTAEPGAAVDKTESWDHTKYTTVRSLPAVQLRYDTHENLLMRKVLDPRRADHRNILRTSTNPRIAALGEEPEELPAGAGVQLLTGAAGAAVKSEGAAAGVLLGQGGAVPLSATADAVDLTGAAPPGPLVVGGRAVAADELAVCDLAGDDDDGDAPPTWHVRKKQAVALAADEL